MKFVVSLFICAALASAQVFPGAVATDADLLVARNSAQTTLATSIDASITTIVLTSGTRFGNNMAITIGTEHIFCTTLSTNTFTGCTRAFNGSSAASHTAGATVSGFLIATHHNAVAAEIKAIEGQLGVNLGNVAKQSGLTTTSVIPRVSASGQLGPSKLTCTASPVTCTLDDDTATTGVTTLRLFAGDGQSTTAVMQIYDPSGVLRTQFNGVGSLNSQASGVNKFSLSLGSITFASDSGMAWRDTTNTDSGSNDTGFSRNAAGILEINNGVAGTLRDLHLRNLRSTGVAGGGTQCLQTDNDGDVSGTGNDCGGGGLSGSSSIDFPSLVDGQCSDQTFSLTGLAAGQAISGGLPAALNTGILSTVISSATDTAKVRLCNFTGATVDLAALTYSVNAPTAISASSAIDFSSLADGACAVNTFTLTGAAAGTRISPGYPGALEAGLLGRMKVVSADTVQVQLCNFSGAALDPASGTFSAAIL